MNSGYAQAAWRGARRRAGRPCCESTDDGVGNYRVTELRSQSHGEGTGSGDADRSVPRGCSPESYLHARQAERRLARRTAVWPWRSHRRSESDSHTGRPERMLGSSDTHVHMTCVHKYGRADGSRGIVRCGYGGSRSAVCPEGRPTQRGLPRPCRPAPAVRFG